MSASISIAHCAELSIELSAAAAETENKMQHANTAEKNFLRFKTSTSVFARGAYFLPYLVKYSLTRRPSHVSARENVKMQMFNALQAVFSDIGDNSKAAFVYSLLLCYYLNNLKNS